MRTSESRYYPLLDAFRFLAAISIVWLHVAGTPRLEWSKALGRAAVPFFTCTAAFLAFDSLRRHPDVSVWHYFAGRFRRIYALFLIWSVIYWAMRNASSLLVEHQGWLRVTPREFFLDGVALQLWFLPFIIVATTAAFAIAKLVHMIPAVRVWLTGIMASGGILAGIFSAPAWLPATGYLPGLAYQTLPALTWGIALGLTSTRASAEPSNPVEPTAEDISQPKPLVANSGAGLGALVFWAWLVVSPFFGRSILLENGAGLGLLLVALNRVSAQPNPVLAMLGSLSFGIYLAHALFVEGLQHVLPKLGLPPSGFRDAIIWLLAVLGSSALILVLKRSGRWAAWLGGS